MHTYIQKIMQYRKDEINMMKTWIYWNLLYKLHIKFYYSNNEESIFKFFGEFFTPVMRPFCTMCTLYHISCWKSKIASFLTTFLNDR